MMLILITRLLFIIIIFSLSLTAVERTPLQVAQEAFEAARDDEHRELVPVAQRVAVAPRRRRYGQEEPPAANGTEHYPALIGK